MPLSPEEQKEMQELEELDALEAKFGGSAPAAAPQEQSLMQKFEAQAQSAPPAESYHGSWTPGGSNLAAGEPPMAIPAGAAPKALSGLASWLSKPGIATAASRIGANTVAGAGNAAVHGHEVKRGALVGAGSGALGELIGGISKAVGATSTGARGKQINDYIANPRMAETLRSEAQYNPQALQDRAGDMAEQATTGLQKGYIDPRMQDMQSKLAGQSFKVSPTEYQGTAAAGELPLPSGEAPMLDVPGDQLLKAKQAAGKAAKVAYKANPMGLTPAASAEAQANGAAAAKLGEVADTVPGVADLNAEVHEAIRNKEGMERLGNPSRLFSGGDTGALGSVPVRANRQYMDANAGPMQTQSPAPGAYKEAMGAEPATEEATFQSLADSLDAAKVVNTPGRQQGSVYRMLTTPLGRAAIKRGIPASRTLGPAASMEEDYYGTKR